MSEVSRHDFEFPPGYYPASWFTPDVSGEDQKSFDGLIAQRGLAVVYGAPGVGKSSWLMSQMYRWGGETEVRYEGTRILYLALEGVADAREWAAAHRREWRPRYTASHFRGKTTQYRSDTNLVVLAPQRLSLLDRPALDAWLTRVGAGGAGEGEWLIPEGLPESQYADWCWEVETVEEPNIVVVDSLSRALDGADENDNGVMSKAVSALEHIRDAFNASLVIAIHHPATGHTHPRGGSALLGGVDSATFIRRKGDTLTAQNIKARGFTDGAVKRYRRRPAPSASLDGTEPELFRMVFDELASEPAAMAARPQAVVPSDPAPNVGDAAEDSPPPEAVKAPVSSDSAPAQPTPPPHPAQGLRGRPAVLWEALGLAPGGVIEKGAALERLKPHPALESVPARRRSVVLNDVFTAFERRGLVVGDTIQNPA